MEFESETLETTEYTKKYVEDTESAVGSQETEGAGMDGARHGSGKLPMKTEKRSAGK